MASGVKSASQAGMGVFILVFFGDMRTGQAGKQAGPQREKNVEWILREPTNG